MLYLNKRIKNSFKTHLMMMQSIYHTVLPSLKVFGVKYKPIVFLMGV